MILQLRGSRAWLSSVAVGIGLLLLPGVSGEILTVSPSLEDAEASQIFAQGGWGANPGQFGKVDEASRPGPTDFTLTDNVLYVLDPVNARVQLFDPDGGFRNEIQIGTRTADFLYVDDAGRVTVLDAFVKREFVTFSPAGEALARVKVPDHIGLCSAIWVDGDRIWLEERHSRVYGLEVVHDHRGTHAAVVQTLPGRPIGRQRGSLHARKAGAGDVIIKDTNTRTLRFDRPVASIVALEADDQGRVYLAVACRCVNSEDPWKTEIVLAMVDAEGRSVDSIRIPNAYITDHYRKLCVSSSGEIIQMQTSENGVSFIRWSPETNLKQGGQR